METVLDCVPVIKKVIFNILFKVRMGRVLEPVVSELRRGLERLQPQCPVGVNSLFGAIHRLAAGRPAQVDQG